MHIALVEPQIPQNTGSIARTCAAMKTPLHIVGEVPFEISDKSVRRAGLDYWPWVTLNRHSSFEQLKTSVPQLGTIWYLSKFATRNYWDVDFAPNDMLVFGSETKGLGASFLAEVQADTMLRIPMEEPEVRSLNLSNAVSIVLYEAKRQQYFKRRT
jgi:tRNA (cytidine/uridine-2'-O-)-methyltransferase